MISDFFQISPQNFTSDSVSSPHRFFNSLILCSAFCFSSFLIWALIAFNSRESFFLPNPWIPSAMVMAMSIYKTLCVLVFISEICHWISSDFRICCRGFTRLRLSEFVQISEFFQFYITDICQTSESFSKSVNLNEEMAVKQSRTVPKVCRIIRTHIASKQILPYWKFYFGS